MTNVGLCAVVGGSERKAQRDIERAGFGVRVLTRRMAYLRKGVRSVRVQPLMPGYVFTHVAPGTDINVPGVRMLQTFSARDEQRLNELELHCLLGDFNAVAHHMPAPKRRRRRPRKSKRIGRG